jgi:hypothetical protein
VVLLVTVLVLLISGAMACTDAGPIDTRPVDPPAPRVSVADVLAAVRTAPMLRVVPAHLTPSPAIASDDIGFDNEKCETPPAADRMATPCVFGDRASDVRVVLFGDSRAGMWLPALAPVALRRHWRLEFYGKPACPAPRLTVWNQQEGRPFAECDRVRDFVLGQIRASRPALVIVTTGSFGQQRAPGVPITAVQWQAALTRTLVAIGRAASRVVLLGETPVLDQSAPDCLAAHAADLPACFTTRAEATARVWNDADRAASAAGGSAYVPVLPWLCGTVCTPVIGNMVVYRNRYQLTATYVRTLSGVLEDALVQADPAAF